MLLIVVCTSHCYGLDTVYKDVFFRANVAHFKIDLFNQQSDRKITDTDYQKLQNIVPNNQPGQIIGLPFAVTHPPSEFYVNVFSSFCVILLTNQPTNMGESHNLPGGGSNAKQKCLDWLSVSHLDSTVCMSRVQKS